ncbi:DUF4198 domain-containing protein [Fretibacterium fastidiosum]|uniref:ABC-type Co2+ transport system, periplasmic component n=1 Tax=Fretibacterium fastidiosum TaxID=651822 RepID=A0AB94IW91_9BACT|nr:DUF4198 domain-containing protein [Fretibacterium fastidiosum]CBL27971.1 ABC-type Co2+ transport system, periplasmic component [Fretibacterium fastidiosum]
MKRGNKVVLAAGLLLGVASAAFAHELVMKPQKMNAAKGETLAVEIHSGHKFIVPEEVESVERIKAGVFKDGKLQEAGLKPNEKNLCIDFSLPVEDASQSMVILANKDGGVWCVTNEGGKSGLRKDLEAQGLKVTKATKNDKFVKVIVNASRDDKNFAVQTGQALEIIPVTNPADAKVGEFFEVKILVDGKPYSGAVWASYDGFAPEYEDTYAYYTQAVQGVAHIKITAPGLWGVRAMKTDLPGKEGEYDSVARRTFLLFEVK